MTVQLLDHLDARRYHPAEYGKPGHLGTQLIANVAAHVEAHR